MGKKRYENQEIVSIAGCCLVGSGIVGQPVAVDPRPADAISSFDAEILAYINDYTEELGIDPLIEHAPLSAAADQWAGDVAQQLNNSFCPAFETVVPENPANLLAEGTPASTVEVIERTAISCGVHSIDAGGSKP